MRHYAIRVAIKDSEIIGHVGICGRHVDIPEQTHTKEENRHDKIKCYAPTNTCTLAKEYIREKNTHGARDKHTQTRHDKRGVFNHAHWRDTWRAGQCCGLRNH